MNDMQRATVFLLTLCVSLLPATGAAASAVCAGLGADTAVQSGCCCGGDSQCAMPGASDAVTDACCSGDTGSENPAPVPLTTIVVQIESAPLDGVFTGVSPVSVPRPQILTGESAPEHPPHYTLFCSLLI